ncbi:hypothetical protein GGR52DRAFT_176902 [Hypoxylon sp. FL1284]|nr:hypothetical protein GGR52DRAFT_176902 [Hypoxylon sp. FL1284]
MSAHPGHSPIPGDNPDYYSESAGAPAELAGDAPQSHPVPPPQAHQNQYPPPPPGPPPSSGVESQYFPPPPPGPPPTSQTHDQYPPPPPPGPPPANLDHQYYPPPPASHGQGQPSPQDLYFPPPPSYSEIEGGVNVTDEKPPILPPRPLSSQGAYATPASQAVPHFPPPPTSPTVSNSQQQQQQQHHGHAASAETSSSSSKSGFGRKLYEWGVKAGVPINKLTNKLGSEAFWPTSIDKECDKAARILKSFCKDGFYTNPSASGQPGPSQGNSNSVGPSSKPKVLVKIPQAAIANAKGLAIFTTFRTGFHISGAGGSGLVVARLPDGSWSPPAGFLVHTLGAGIMAGLDIYDCVCVLNTPAAAEAFTKPRLSLGGEMAVVAGPVGAGTVVETALAKGSKPVWSYMKSRGLYGGVQVDGTVIVHRPDANAAFYGVDKISVDSILKSQVRDNTGRTPSKKDEGLVMWPQGARQLMEVLKAAEGKRADEGVMRALGDQPTPGDLAPTPEPYAANPDAKDGARYA